MPDGAKPAPAAETTLSTKGQVVLPKAVRDRLGWRPGTRVTIEQTPDGVVLRRAPLFRPTTIDEVAGCLKPYYKGPPISVEDMDKGIEELFRSEWGRQFDPS
jgi:AbrB family looped-hinge helix DNA binding protein